MPIEGSAGTLDIENATLRSNAIAVLANLVTGNDRVRESGAPALEVYGDPSHGGNEARLEMVSNTATVSSSAFTRLTSNVGVFSIETGTDASDNGTITFGGFANERLRITSDGKVGVGTNGPAEKLDVQGSALITGSTYGIKSTGTLGSDKSEGWYRLLIGGIRDGASAIRTECKLQLTASGLHQTLTFDFNHMISLTDTSGNSFNLLGNDHYINRAGITKLRLADAGSNQFALDMYIDHDIVSVDRDWTITLYTEGGSLISEATTFLEKITATPSASIELDTDTSIFGIVGSTTSKTLIMHENGNVGIGTTNPATQLEIRGQTTSSIPTIRLTNTAPGNDVQDLGGLEVYSVDGGGDFCGSIIVRRDNTGASPDGNIVFRCGQNGISSDRMIIKENGNVGIGTNNPVAKLILNAYGNEGTTNCFIIGTNTGSQNLRLGVNSVDQYCWIQSHAGKPLRLNPSGNTVQYGTANTTLSDDRIKDNEVYIENATDTLLKLKPQVYDKKLIWNISKLGETSNTSIVRESGLITQDVWYDAPELRHLVQLGEGAEPGDDKPYTDNDPTNDPDYSSWGDNVSLLDYTGLIPYLIKSNQELHTELQTVKARLDTLEGV